MNGSEGFLPKNQNFTTQVARILWYRPDRQINMTLTLNSLNPDCVAVHKSVSPSVMKGHLTVQQQAVSMVGSHIHITGLILTLTHCWGQGLYISNY